MFSADVQGAIGKFAKNHPAIIEVGCPAESQIFHSVHFRADQRHFAAVPVYSHSFKVGGGKGVGTVCASQINRVLPIAAVNDRILGHVVVNPVIAGAKLDIVQNRSGRGHSHITCGI